MKGQLYIPLFLILISACGNEGVKNDEYRSYLLKEFSNEEVRLKNEIIDEVQETEMKESDWNVFSRQSKVDQFLRSDSVISTQDHIIAATILDLRDSVLSSIGTYVQGKKHWKIKTDPFNNWSCNPEDTARLNMMENTFGIALNESIDEGLGLLFLDHINYEQWKQLKSKTGYSSPYFGTRIKPVIFPATRVWNKGDEAFVIAAYGAYDLNEIMQIEFEGKMYQSQIQIKAENKPGIYSYSGAYSVKEKGELVWKPFEITILVE